MKKLTLLFFLFALTVTVKAQCFFRPGSSNFTNGLNTGCDTNWLNGLTVIYNEGLTIGDSILDTKALLELTSTTKGILIPRLTTTQQNAISSPPAGLIIFNTDSGALCWYNSSWRCSVSGSAASDTSWLTRGNIINTNNFIGSKNSIDLVFKRANTPAGRLGFDNVSFGRNAGISVTDSNARNTAIGSRALQSATGIDNTAVGGYALISNSTGTQNTAVGVDALGSVTTGSRNVGIGTSGGPTITTGSDNTAVGYQSLASVTTGGNNISVGNFSGTTLTTGSRNTFIGYNAKAAATSTRSSVALGYNATAANNTFALSDSLLSLKARNITYTWPDSQGAANSALINDGSGGLSWGLVTSYIKTGSGLYFSNDTIFRGGAYYDNVTNLLDTSFYEDWKNGTGNTVRIGRGPNGGFWLLGTVDTAAISATGKAAIMFANDGSFDFSANNSLVGTSADVKLRANIITIGDAYQTGNKTGIQINDGAQSIDIVGETNIVHDGNGITQAVFTNTESVVGDYDAINENYFLYVNNSPSPRIDIQTGSKRIRVTNDNDTINLKGNAPVIIDSLRVLPGQLQSSGIYSGVYLPQAVDSFNTSGITFDSAQYIKTGNVVTVSGLVSFTTSGTFIEIKFNPPLVTSAPNNNCTGVATLEPPAGTDPRESFGVHFSGTPFGVDINGPTVYSSDNVAFYYSYTFRYH